MADSSGCSSQEALTLQKSNAEPCKDINELFNDCELTTFFATASVEDKVRQDLKLLETEMYQMIQRAQEQLGNLHVKFTDMTKDSSLDAGEAEKAANSLEVVDELVEIFKDFVEHFTRTKALQASLPPFVHMGGYRSLMVSVIDTIQLLVKELDKTVTTSLISRGGRAVVSNFLGRRRSIGLFRRSNGASDPGDLSPRSQSTLLDEPLSLTQSEGISPPDPDDPINEQFDKLNLTRAQSSMEISRGGEERTTPRSGRRSERRSPATPTTPRSSKTRRRKNRPGPPPDEPAPPPPPDQVSESSGRSPAKRRRSRKRKSRAEPCESDCDSGSDGSITPRGRSLLDSDLDRSGNLERDDSSFEPPDSIQTPKELQKFFQANRDRIRAEMQTERDRLAAELKALDEREATIMAKIDKEEKYQLRNFDGNQKKKRSEASVRGYRNQVKRCFKASRMLSTLISKLRVCCSIPAGQVFTAIEDMYRDSQFDPAEIYVDAHLGYEVDRDMVEYSKKMKVVYCAVASSIQEGGSKGISGALTKQMQFSYSAMRYLLDSKSASEKYGALRQKLDIKSVRNVWDLLEDPMTSFFATTLGIAPAMEKMKINLEIRVPVPAQEIFYQVTETQRKMYRTRQSLTKEGSQSEHSEDDFSTSSPDHQGATATDIGIPDENESYLIRCRFINPFPSPVDPSLVMQTASRTNFKSKDQEEATKKVPDALTRIFGKKLTTANISSSKAETPESHVYENAEEMGDMGNNTLIVHIHGGGWVSQSPDQHISYVSEWAKMANAPVISIDYSLSPEVQYPIAPNECYAIYKWLLNPDNAVKLGLPRCKKPLRIVVCGDSAGGNLTCAVVLRAIREGVQLPIGLLLHYPAGILSASGSLARMIFSNDPILNYQTMRVVLDCYLGKEMEAASRDSLISPALASDAELALFPTTVICVGDVDPLIDDSTYIFERFHNVGVKAVLRVFRALPHGYLNLPTQLSKAVGAIKAAGIYMDWLFKDDLSRQDPR